MNPAESWNIRELADLILGPSDQSGDSSPVSATPAVSNPAESPPSSQSSQARAIMVLVPPGLDSIECVSSLADYWSNRGETVAVFWVGQAGIKVGLFNCSRQVAWAHEMIDALQDGRDLEIPQRIHQSVRRFVWAVTLPTPQDAVPMFDAIQSTCVVIDPTKDQLIQGYQIFKTLAQSNPDRRWSCFVFNATSAIEATDVAARLQKAADQFLHQKIAFEGFSVEQSWPTSNLIAETLIANRDPERLSRLIRSLLQTASTAVEEYPQEDASTDDDSDESPTSSSKLPIVRLLPIDQPIQSVAQMDELISHHLHELCHDAVDSFPVYTSPLRGCTFRWIRRKHGARSMMVSTLETPTGVMECAASQLYPLQRDDEIIVIAANVGSEYRKAAQIMNARMRLLEVAQLPPHDGSALVFKDVTYAVA